MNTNNDAVQYSEAFNELLDYIGSMEQFYDFNRGSRELFDYLNESGQWDESRSEGDFISLYKMVKSLKNFNKASYGRHCCLHIGSDGEGVRMKKCGENVYFLQKWMDTYRDLFQYV